MTVEYRKRFIKELAKIPTYPRKEIENFVFKEIIKSGSIFKSGKIEHLKGYTDFYKIRFGNYRVGIKLKGDLIIFERVLHRKDIYRFFP